MSSPEVPPAAATSLEPPADSYAFVMNVRGFADFASVELAPSHVLRRATDTEIEEIRRVLETLSGPGQRHRAHAWEIRWSDDRRKTEELPRELWRHFVVAFRGSNATMSTLGQACDLSSAEPEIGPVILKGTLAGTVYESARLLQASEQAALDPDFFIELSRADVGEISELHRLLVAHNNVLVDMELVTRQLRHLKALPYQSPLRFLGYFAVLESLLTHTPHPTDPYDSITRQVKTKLALLDHRFSRPLDYGAFGGAAAETIWARMYKYRSLVAHGQPARIEGDLAVLRSHEQALALVRATTKAVARQVLREPRLLTDLRDC